MVNFVASFPVIVTQLEKIKNVTEYDLALNALIKNCFGHHYLMGSFKRIIYNY